MEFTSAQDHEQKDQPGQHTLDAAAERADVSFCAIVGPQHKGDISTALAAATTAATAAAITAPATATFLFLSCVDTLRPSVLDFFS